MAVDLGRVAYMEYYRFSKGCSLITGAPLPLWEDQKQEIQDAWRHAAVAVISAIETGVGMTF